MKIHSGNTPTGIWAGMQITNIENTYPLGITPEPKDSEEGAHTGVNKRSRRKEAHDDDDSAGCDGGWRRWRRGWRVTRGSRKPPGIYVRRSFASLTIRGASALTALRQQAGVVETYNEKIMNPVHRVCLECQPGCRSPPPPPPCVDGKAPYPPRSFRPLPLCLPFQSSVSVSLQSRRPHRLFLSAALMPLATLLYRVPRVSWWKRIFQKRVSFATSANEKKGDFAFKFSEIRLIKRYTKN